MYLPRDVIWVFATQTTADPMAKNGLYSEFSHSLFKQH